MALCNGRTVRKDMGVQKSTDRGKIIFCDRIAICSPEKRQRKSQSVPWGSRFGQTRSVEQTKSCLQPADRRLLARRAVTFTGPGEAAGPSAAAVMLSAQAWDASRACPRGSG